jgi:hypothetical protein
MYVIAETKTGWLHRKPKAAGADLLRGRVSRLRVHQRAPAVAVHDKEHASGGETVGDVLGEGHAVDTAVWEAEEGAVAKRGPGEKRRQ